MRRFGFIICLIGCWTWLNASPSDVSNGKPKSCYIDPNLDAAIQHINRKEYEDAANSLRLAKSWHFSSKSISKMERADDFLRQLYYSVWDIKEAINERRFSANRWDYSFDLKGRNIPHYAFDPQIEYDYHSHLFPIRFNEFIDYLNQHPIPSYRKEKLLLYYRAQLNSAIQYFFNNWEEPNGILILPVDFIVQTSTCYEQLKWTHSALQEPDDIHYAQLVFEAGSFEYVHASSSFLEGGSYFEDALELYTKLSGEESEKALMSALCLGNINFSFGDYMESEKYLKLAIRNTKSPVAPIAHWLLGKLYIYLGDHLVAEDHLKLAVDLSKRRHNYRVTGQALYELVRMYDKQDLKENLYTYKDEAIRYLSLKQQVKTDSLLSNVITKNEEKIQYALPYLTFLQDDIEQIETALLNDATQNVLRYEDRINIYNKLGKYYFDTGKYIQAAIYIQKALSNIEYRYAVKPSNYSEILRTAINLYNEMELSEEAKHYIDLSAKENKDRFINSVSFLTERQRDQYWKELQKDFQEIYPVFAYRHYLTWHDLTEMAYDNELFTKGLLLTSADAIKRSILSSGDTILIAQWEQLTALRQAIKAMQERMTEDSKIIDEYEQRAEDLEKEITINSSEYRYWENMQQWSITWDSVRKALKPQQVAIEYMSAPINEDSTMYCALLLRDTCSQPILIPLFEQKEVDTLLYTSTKDSVEIRKTYTYINHGKALSDRIWNNVKPYLNAGDTVYFSATGVLHQIAIENLWYDSARTMADTYTMVRLSSTRELAIEREPIVHQTATIYGGIYYSAEAQTMVDVHKKQKFNANTQDKFLAYNQTRGGLAHANPLTATQYEISATEAILKDKHFHVEVLSGHMANEESFKHLSGQKQNILHIATHGFYTPDSTFQNPLERCGLLFAGANILIDGNIQQLRNIDKNVEDGLVTAKDISLMDLRGADIVVLSACETGLGDVTGEGVFGLQRAFKMAGAQTLIMSLWQVHDLSTQILMTAFYKHWIEKGESKHQAFRAAQQEVRNSGFDSPYYWAGFILLD